MHTSSIAADDENGLCGNSSEKQQSQWLNGLFLYQLFAQTDSGLFFFAIIMPFSLIQYFSDYSVKPSNSIYLSRLTISLTICSDLCKLAFKDVKKATSNLI